MVKKQVTNDAIDEKSKKNKNKERKEIWRAKEEGTNDKIKNQESKFALVSQQ